MLPRPPTTLTAWLLTCSLLLPLRVSPAQGPVERAEKADFFEARIRPALLEHCLECHAVETEASGGLLLDSPTGWQAGGDSGVAIVPGDVLASRLMKAIDYDDPNLQMPPDGKLPTAVIEDFRRWIADGAVDPRGAKRPEAAKQIGMLVEQAQEHWAYRDRLHVAIAPLTNSAASTPIDAFIDFKLSQSQLAAASAADSATLIRRLYFDLTGLPPTPEELQLAVDLIHSDPGGYTQLVDCLLGSPHYGEHMARKWMDVARYADSITLRGFVLPEAWRYRDYLVASFAADRPFDRMIIEQVAGDLLPAEDLSARQSNLVATGFLVMGNTNLEQQDKSQLEMDYIDEQLEVIGRAFLGQTIGCARCHDHKFDPIPTRDYYALAGIMRSTVALAHENVSKWIERPLPLSAEEEAAYAALEKRLQSTKNELARLKKLTNRQQESNQKSIAINELPGIIVDNLNAKLVGRWMDSTSAHPYVAAGYVHDANAEKGQKTATFEPPALPPGEYEVRLAYTAASNRATNALVRVFSADGEVTILVDQTKPPASDGPWFSLGHYRFEKNGQAFVLVSNSETDGHVIVDAVQFLPAKILASPVSSNAVGQKSQGRKSTDQIGQAAIGPVAKPANTASAEATHQDLASTSALPVEDPKAWAKQLEALEVERGELQLQLDARPMVLSLLQQATPTDIPVHIRGDVHNLGPTVPRGFLTALNRSSTPQIAADSGGRLEWALWLSSPDNPLTARVYANRVWSWLMGQGIVASINNFGTTGLPPTHPELLDWLAAELVAHNWSTKHLVRQIVHSNAYRRQWLAPDANQAQLDPNNTLYWRGQARRLTAESIRDAMLKISGELDASLGGSLIASKTKEDYNYAHGTTRRSLYHPVFRNSLPELFEAFDFADTSISVGQRPRSTVATQALVLLNHPWIAARAAATAARLRRDYGGSENYESMLRRLYLECFARPATEQELADCMKFLEASSPSPSPAMEIGYDRLELLVHSLLASLDFRFLD